MVGRQTGFRGSKSIAGAALVGLGAFILYENLAGAVVRLSQVLGANGSGALGVLPAVILAGSRVVQAYPAGHQRFLHGLLQQVLVSSWPLLLVMVGTVLSRDALEDNVNVLPKKDCGRVDLTARRSTLK